VTDFEAHILMRSRTKAIRWNKSPTNLKAFILDLAFS